MMLSLFYPSTVDTVGSQNQIFPPLLAYLHLHQGPSVVGRFNPQASSLCIHGCFVNHVSRIKGESLGCKVAIVQSLRQGRNDLCPSPSPDSKLPQNIIPLYICLSAKWYMQLKYRISLCSAWNFTPPDTFIYIPSAIFKIYASPIYVNISSVQVLPGQLYLTHIYF